MRSILYYVRHALPDYRIVDQMSRPLSEHGIESLKYVESFFKNKSIDAIFSSPYLRAIQTIDPVAKMKGVNINILEGLKERQTSLYKLPTENYVRYAERQWLDQSYKLPGGESIRDVRKRNIEALNNILIQCQKNEYKYIVVGGHITALSSIISYYNSKFDYDSFQSIRYRHPWIVKFEYDELDCLKIISYDDKGNEEKIWLG